MLVHIIVIWTVLQCSVVTACTTGVLFECILGSDIYNESAEVTNRQAIRRDVFLTNNDHGKGVSSCARTGASNFREMARNFSRSNSVGLLLPKNNLLSDETVVTVLPTDPLAGIFYGSQCSTHSSGTGSSYHIIWYTKDPATGRMIPHGSNKPMMQQSNFHQRLCQSLQKFWMVIYPTTRLIVSLIILFTHFLASLSLMLLNITA